MTQTSSGPLMLPPKRAAAELGVPEYTVRVWLSRGLIKSIPCGRKKLINVDLLRRQLETGEGALWQ